MEKIERFVQASKCNLDTMLEYVISSITRLASYIGLNLPTYTIYYTKKIPEIICQATGRLVVPLLLVLKESPQAISVEELPIAKKVSNLVIKPIKMTGVVIPVPVIEELPAVIPVVEKLPVPLVKPVVKNHYFRNTRPGHLPVECEGCEKHPLMSPLICRMMISQRSWGDMLYDGVI